MTKGYFKTCPKFIVSEAPISKGEEFRKQNEDIIAF